MKKTLLTLVILLIPALAGAYTADLCQTYGQEPVEVWAQDSLYFNTEAEVDTYLANNPGILTCPYMSLACPVGALWKRHNANDCPGGTCYPWQLQMVQAVVPRTPPLLYCAGQPWYSPSVIEKCDYYCGIIPPQMVFVSPLSNTVKSGKAVTIAGEGQDPLGMAMTDIYVTNAQGAIIRSCASDTIDHTVVSCVWQVPTGRGKTYTLFLHGLNNGGAASTITKPLTSN